MFKNHPVLRLSDLKARHAMLVLSELRRREPLSRVELSQLVGCDGTTITRAVKSLMSRGLVVGAGKAESANGRPRERLVLNPSGGVFIGVALSPSGITGALTDLKGRIIQREQALFPPRPTRALFLETLERVTRGLLDAAGAKFLGMGISTFGTSLDGGLRLQVTANFPELRQLDLQEFFRTRFGLAPEFADMMLCRMQYELNRDPALSRGCTMLVSAGRGIGMALALDGKVVLSRGRHGGELGHNICEPDGLPCQCGRRGCLETRCSTGVLLRQAREATGDDALSFDRFAADYRRKRAYARSIVAPALRHLSIALANQVNNLSPDQVVLDGELPLLGDAFCRDLEAAVRALLFQAADTSVAFHFRTRREDSDLLGAAFLAIDARFNDPDFFAEK